MIREAMKGAVTPKARIAEALDASDPTGAAA